MPSRIPTLRSSTTLAPPYPPDTPRYRITIYFHSAHSLPIADVPSFNSDPYVFATLRFPNTTLPKLHHRTRTIRSSRAPVWEDSWTIGNVPASGIMLKMKVMDEDPGDGDDVLGITRIETGTLSGGEGRSIGRQQTLRMGTGKWVTFLKIAMCSVGQKGVVEFGLEVSEDDEAEGEWPYTVGPNAWTQHFSPLIGIITHTVADHRPNRIQHYSFAATKLQLSGPIPPELRHRYVAFRPIIKTFYTKQGALGVLLNRALKHQYRTIYSYDKATTYGVTSSNEVPRKFLELTNYGEGGRLYTYIITLDGEWRFTETGKEFGIQMLSKHTMHSCVGVYVAMAGEFFVRKIQQHHHNRPRSSEGHSVDLKDYELVIDNDSGTYRPPKECLPALQSFLSRNLPGLKVSCPDAFEEYHIKEKKDHVAEKERTGRRFFKQPSSSRSSSEEPGETGSISSSDEEEVMTGRVGRVRSVKRKFWRGVERKAERGKFHDKGKAKVEQNAAPAVNGERAA